VLRHAVPRRTSMRAALGLAPIADHAAELKVVYKK
jgi:hypothetical protein